MRGQLPLQPLAQLHVPAGDNLPSQPFAALVKSLLPKFNFTTCGVGRDEFSAIMQSCLMGGHMRVGLEDNVRVSNGDMAKGNYELVEWAGDGERSGYIR